MDFNGDKIPDLLSGSYSPGQLFVFPGNKDGGFDKAQIINDSSNKPLVLGYASVPFAYDWDQDGDLDLIVGTIDGNVYYVPNTGSAPKPVYSPDRQQLIKHRGGGWSFLGNSNVALVESDAGPIVADWDGDGIPDLLVGSGDGSVQLFRATKRDKDKTPVLSAPVTLLPAGNQDEPNHPWGIRTKICVADYNGDGRPDLLVGDFQSTQPYHGYVWLFLRKPPPAKP